MQIAKTSAFKSPNQDHQWLLDWAEKLSRLNQTQYQKIELNTELGKTVVWGINTDQTNLETLVIFPGFRTTVLFWDLDNALGDLKKKYRIFMVETNGQPNLSDGNTPDIKSEGYGVWAAEVMTNLGLEKAFIAGASFGGLVCMKLCMVAPEKVKAAFLLNPGCLQMFSLSPKNLYYNLLPIFSPSEKNVRLFMDKAVFCKPNHQLSPEAEQLLIDYEIFALTRYNDKTQKPYPMGKKELGQVNTPVYLIEGDKDPLFPFQKSIAAAQKNLPNLAGLMVLPDVGHGIETYGTALSIMGGWMEMK
ncbi:MAG: alpha/beta hydrolase [Bacteroidia bacterium]